MCYHQKISAVLVPHSGFLQKYDFLSRTNSSLGHHDDLATKYSLLHQNQNRDTWMNSINIHLALFCTVLLLLSRFSRVRLCVTPQTAAHQAPLTVGFARQEYWRGLPLPSALYCSVEYKKMQFRYLVSLSCIMWFIGKDCEVPRIQASSSNKVSWSLLSSRPHQQGLFSSQ